MGKIFVLMGKSATGKNSIYYKLCRQQEIKLRTAVPYTTRPIREKENNGTDYFFVSAAEMERLEKERKIIEHRVYQTVHGPWHYFTADDGQIDLSSGSYILIGTLEAYEGLVSYFGASAVLPVYIEVPDQVRIHRALEREDGQSEPKYKEMCRRFLMDEEDFSELRLQACGIEKRYQNLDLEECTKEIIKDIKSGIGHLM